MRGTSWFSYWMVDGIAKFDEQKAITMKWMYFVSLVDESLQKQQRDRELHQTGSMVRVLLKFWFVGFPFARRCILCEASRAKFTQVLFEDSCARSETRDPRPKTSFCCCSPAAPPIPNPHGTDPLPRGSLHPPASRTYVVRACEFYHLSSAGRRPFRGISDAKFET